MILNMKASTKKPELNTSRRDGSPKYVAIHPISASSLALLALHLSYPYPTAHSLVIGRNILSADSISDDSFRLAWFARLLPLPFDPSLRSLLFIDIHF